MDKFIADTATIVGLGLIGGSIAKAASERKIFRRIFAVDINGETLRKIEEAGIAEKVTNNIFDVIDETDLLILSTPPEQITKIAKEVLRKTSGEFVLTDVGSIKRKIVEEVECEISSNVSFIGGHPLAGTEFSGFDASFSTLFDGKICVLTPTGKTNPDALNIVKEMWKRLGSYVVEMDPIEHDRIFAMVSHLPHVLAYTIVNTVANAEEYHGELFQFTGAGFRDFTRIASSDPIMWRDICILNRDNILYAIESFEKELENMKMAIREGNRELLRKTFAASKKARDATIRGLINGEHKAWKSKGD